MNYLLLILFEETFNKNFNDLDTDNENDNWFSD